MHVTYRYTWEATGADFTYTHIQNLSTRQTQINNWRQKNTLGLQSQQTIHHTRTLKVT